MPARCPKCRCWVARDFILEGICDWCQVPPIKQNPVDLEDPSVILDDGWYWFRQPYWMGPFDTEDEAKLDRDDILGD